MGGGAFLDYATSIEVGDDVLIAFDVLIMDYDSHSVVFAERQNDVGDWNVAKKSRQTSVPSLSGLKVSAGSVRSASS